MKKMTNRLSVSMEVLIFVTHAYIYPAVVAICQDIVDRLNRHHGTQSPLVRQGPCNWLFFFFIPLVFPFVALSITSFALSPDVFHVSLDCIFPSYSSLPFTGILVPNTFLGVCSSSLLVTCPYPFDIPSVVF